MHVEITLREYRVGDLDAMYALDVVCFEPPFRFSRAAMRRFAQARKARVVIAEDGHTLAGFAILHVQRSLQERVGYIMTLDVDPMYRLRGLGRRLIAALEAQAQADGCAALALHVFAGNAAAIAFYERNGFRRVHEALSYYAPHVDAWVYRKRLQR
jgi:ribosomal-protein-alanine N-acetyltransferase